MGTQGGGCAPTHQTSQSSYIRVTVEDRLCTVLVDTGASHSFVSKYTFDNEFQHLSRLITFEHKSIKVANSASMYSEGFITTKIRIGSIITTAKLWILENLCTGIILGLDWLTSGDHKTTIDFDTNSLSISLEGEKSSTPLLRIKSDQGFRARICEKITLEPMEEKTIEVKVIELPNCDTAQFTPGPNFLHQDSILMPHALIKIRNHKTLMTIMNISTRPRTINRNTPIGTIEIETPTSSCFHISSTLHQQQGNNNQQKEKSREIKKTIEGAVSHLTHHDERQQLSSILQQYTSLFDTSKPRIAKTHLHHTIPTGDSKPVNSRPYRIPPEKQEVIDNEIKSMAENGLIRPSQSAWSSPVVLVKKKDGKYRFCVDYRRLNAVTMKDSYPLPHIEDTIKQLGGSSYFSKLDLKSGYFQLPIDENDKSKTAFITSRGLWEFNVLPQGLKNSPPSFQRVLNNLLANGRWQFCLIYLDDIIIYSKSFNEHCEHLNNVLEVLDRANFQLNPPKCSFAQSEIDYLGHSINIDGYKPLNTNIDAITMTPNPRTSKQVHSFLQMANFYRKFIHNFTELTDRCDHSRGKIRSSIGEKKNSKLGTT